MSTNTSTNTSDAKYTSTSTKVNTNKTVDPTATTETLDHRNAETKR